MLFKRRQKPGLKERIHTWVWPRRGWRRAWGYALHRVKRLSGSPHSIALGFAAGAFASFTPFVGLHFMLGFIVAYLIGGNLVASAIGTFVGNPLTFPLIWFATYTLGSLILGIEFDHIAASSMPVMDLSTLWTDWGEFWHEFWEKIWPVIKPMIVAGVPMGIVMGAICYWPVKLAVSAYQAKRRTYLQRENGRIGNEPQRQTKETRS